jgi:uncharacterized protein YbjT (DUF2867 family)
MQHTYLVTGATGRTGVHTIDNLLAGGHAVRALVHKEDVRSAALREAGAQVIVGDLLEHDDLRRAMDGVKGAYFCYPVRPGFIHAAAYAAEAAKRAGVDVLVEMSQISAREDSLSHAARDHWVAERLFDWSAVPTVHLRPTFFAEWLLFPPVRDALLDEGKITLPYGEGRHAPIAAQDQARLIAAILTAPAEHVGKTYTLHGPVEMSQAELAEELSRVLDRRIVYSPSTMDAYRAKLSSYGLPDFLVQHFVAVAADYQEGLFSGTGDVIARITGQAPQTVAQFVEARRQLFRRQATT